jgi:hypothetical protein
MIDRLWSKTKDGALKWNQLGSATSFEVRLGDFSIQLRGPPAMSVGLQRGVMLKILKLDGTEVATVGTGMNSLAALAAGHTLIQSNTEAILEQLFKHVSSRDSDLDELLKLLN